MNFFKKGIEYNNLAKAFNGHSQMLSQLELKLENEDEDVTEDFYVLAYLGRKEIIDRLEEYKWNMNSLIVVPNLGGRTTVVSAMQMTISRLTLLAQENNLLEEVQEIMNKGDLYFELDKTIPDYIKKLL